MTQLTVAVAGATGYAGGEIIRILAAHPNFRVTTVAGHSTVGTRFGELVPNIPALADLIVQDATPAILNGHDVIVLALPHGASGAIADQLDPQATVIDLGADHRLESPDDWHQFYGGQYYAAWSYGLPELILGRHANGMLKLQREHLAGTRRIAAPGCNVTAVTFALQPALAAGLIELDSIVADLAVGYSGAGKNLKRTNLLAAEALNSATPYSVGGTHRHIPEMIQNLGHAAHAYEGTSARARVCMAPVLVPMSRGILACVSARMSERARGMDTQAIRQAWHDAYDHEYFVELLPEGMMPATQNVLGSNAAHVQVAVDRASDRIQAFAAIDNLNRGTAGQAVQSLNIALGIDESTGLTKIGVAP